LLSGIGVLLPPGIYVFTEGNDAGGIGLGLSSELLMGTQSRVTVASPDSAPKTEIAIAEMPM
jgi:hypothetical protein